MESKNRERLVAAMREALSARPEVTEAYLFGSWGRGDAATHSDVDVACRIDLAAAPSPAFGLRADLTTELMAALGTNDVDVVLLNDATPLLYHRVLRDGIRILSRDLEATTTREGRALSRYCDDLPRLAMVDRLLAARKAAE